MDSHRLWILVAILLLMIPCAVASAVASAEYSLSTTSSIDTPGRTVSWEGENFQVSQVSQVSPGEKLQVEVSAPGGENYDVYLYHYNPETGEVEIFDTEGGSGSQTVTFDTTGFPPGTYLATIYSQGQFEAIHPIVIASYNVTITRMPSKALTGDTFSVELRVTPRGDNKGLYDVDVVLLNEDVDVHGSTTQTGANTYESTISLEEVPPGDYRLYGVARGENTFRGRHETLGLSKPSEISIGTGIDGGGNGGGVAPLPAEDPSNIRRKLVDTIPSISSGERIRFQFKEGRSLVHCIRFKYNTAADDVRVILEELKGPSTLVDRRPPGEVYQCFNLYVSLPVDNALENPEIEVSVNKTWLEENEKGEVRLARWNHSRGAWTLIPLEKTGEGRDVILLRAEVPGFSQYAITSVEQTSETPTSTANGVLNPNLSSSTPTKTPVTPYRGIWALIALFAGAAFWRR